MPDFDEPAEVVEDDYNEEPPAEPKSKLGDIWQLGNHRLICGDSTDPAVIDRLMDGVKADMVFTDPPYGMKKESEGVLNDNLNFDELLDFNRQWIPLTFGALKDNGSWYCWGIDEPLMDIYSEILRPMKKQKGQDKLTFRNLITWDKGSGQGQLSEDLRMYPIADEKCLFVMMGVQGFSDNADNYFEAWEPIRIYLKQERDRMGWSNADMKKMCGHSPTSGCHWFDKSQWMMPTEEEYKTWQHHAKGEGFKKEYEGFKKEYEEIKKEYEEIKKEYYSTRAYFDNTHDNMNNVWHFDRTSQEERKDTGGHATPKPIALCGRAIKSSSREGEIVLDVFGGSGSTLIACEQLNRKCYMCELDPHYVDVIIERWETFTGQKAVKLN
ncbi:MAG: Modification methylase MboII [Bacteroidetes bacterium ADurb.BinA104]|nr:MAG: Modification methylase MboII [Bacteroidetes bacterium ADurb.BinA104]